MDILEESEELTELYRLYGIAAHNCSNIEYRIAYLLLGPKWNEIEDLNPEKVTEVSENLYSKPLGALLNLYKHHYEFTDETIKQMDIVLDKRNYLVHRFFGAYGKRMHNKEVIKEMIEELVELNVIFQTASHSIDPDIYNKV